MRQPEVLKYLSISFPEMKIGAVCLISYCGGRLGPYFAITKGFDSQVAYT